MPTQAATSCIENYAAQDTEMGETWRKAAAMELNQLMSNCFGPLMRTPSLISKVVCRCHRQGACAAAGVGLCARTCSLSAWSKVPGLFNLARRAVHLGWLKVQKGLHLIRPRILDSFS